jgi:sugar-specific transcriptional regulator TrmB
MKNSLLELEEVLKQFFRLTSYESRVYLALLKSPMRLDELSRASRVPKPRIYDVVKSLLAKGFAVEQNGVYKANDPEAALTARRSVFQLEFEREEAERQRAQRELVAALRARAEGGGEHAKGPILLRGLPSIATMIFEVVPSAQTIFLTLNKAFEAKEGLRQLVFQLNPVKKASIRVLLPLNTELDDLDHELIGKFGADVRVTNGFLLDMMITDNYDVFMGLPDPTSTDAVPVVAIYLRDQAFASSLMNSVELLWRSGTSLNAGTQRSL